MPKTDVDLTDPALYVNRELAWLAFNERVLEEAEDLSNPPLERLKFLAIFSSNLDEFFQVRVAGLKEQVAAGLQERTVDGMTAAEQLAAISLRTHELVDRQYRCLREQVLPILAENGIVLRIGKQLTELDRMAVNEFFRQEVFPILTPMAVDPAHPFPHVANKTLCLAVILERRTAGRMDRLFAVVPVPPSVKRLIPLQMLCSQTARQAGDEQAFTLLSDLIRVHLSDLFCGLYVLEAVPFRVTRDSDLEFDEETDDLLASIEQELRKRQRGEAVRLEIAARASDDIVARLTDALSLEPTDVYRVDGPLDLTVGWQLVSLPGLDHLRNPPHTPVPVTALGADEPLPKSELFRRIRARDVLVHHPYESFRCVVDFLDAASDDERVLAIKQTLYRTSKDSPILVALERAAQSGKQVTALMELKARFDEENNIAWAKRLERAGVHVVYGLVGLKTHCKLALVVRRDEDHRIRQYVHIGTGNYNPSTAKLYTDIGMFTADEQLGQDAAALFNLLTGYSEIPAWHKLCVAPMDMHGRICAWIDREIVRHEKTRRGRIIIKCNAIVDPKIIRQLYRASQAGVKIDLIVRGACCLRPRVPGVSENICVRSVVDRFLEHSRVLYFHNGGQEEVWVGSADLMPRNLFKRVEALFPVEQEDLRSRLVREILGANLKDNVRARKMQADGSYTRPTSSRGKPFRMQFWLSRRAERRRERELAEALRQQRTDTGVVLRVAQRTVIQGDPDAEPQLLRPAARKKRDG